MRYNEMLIKLTFILKHKKYLENEHGHARKDIDLVAMIPKTF